LLASIEAFHSLRYPCMPGPSPAGNQSHQPLYSQCCAPNNELAGRMAAPACPTACSAASEGVSLQQGAETAPAGTYNQYTCTVLCGGNAASAAWPIMVQGHLARLLTPSPLLTPSSPHLLSTATTCPQQSACPQHQGRATAVWRALPTPVPTPAAREAGRSVLLHPTRGSPAARPPLPACRLAVRTPNCSQLQLSTAPCLLRALCRSLQPMSLPQAAARSSHRNREQTRAPQASCAGVPRDGGCCCWCCCCACCRYGGSKARCPVAAAATMMRTVPGHSRQLPRTVLPQ
jgi:hypothetical protein